MHTALITGASSGIGEALAYLLASKQVNLLITARSQNKLEALAATLQEQYGINVAVLPLDLSQKDSPEVIYNYCKDNDIRIDYLINNAGFGEGGNFAEGDWSIYEQMIDLNMKSLVHLCHLFLPDMLQVGNGRILNVASTAGFLPGPGMNVYFASKAFVLHFSEALSMELRGTGVSVTALCPGPTQTDFFETAQIKDTKLFRNGLMSVAMVAEYGYRAMVKGKRVAIPGIKNRLMIYSIRWSPRILVMKVAQSLNRKSSAK